MNIEKNTLGKTFITRIQPWGTNTRTGHRLLCSDGVIRAAELAETADTFFSTPAKVRVKNKWVSGYMTIETQDGLSTGTPSAYVFRHHTVHDDKLPAWPSRLEQKFIDILLLGNT